MALWLVRAGRYGEQEAIAIEKSVAVIGWDKLPDLSHVTSRDKLEELCQEAYPDAKPNTVANWVGQLWTFRERMSLGDLVVLPLKRRSAIAVGRVAGPYLYHPDFPPGAQHTRLINRLRTDIPRTAFDKDLLYSFGALSTVCRIQRNKAEERVVALLSGQAAPPPERQELEPEEVTDLEEHALDQIRDYVGRKFRGHDLARLVNNLLEAQGYRTQLSLAGADGGVDIIAGYGPLGFDSPRLCVQVKSTDSPVDVGILRELQGVMKGFGANQGLLVSWGGFKSSLLSEARQHFFDIRLWDADDLLQALLKNYERLPEEVQAELPLKRIWALVREE